MARRSADRSEETHLLMVAPAVRTGSPRRVRSVPVADLLAREGKPLDLAEAFLLADAVASVRRGMAGLAAGVLALAGVAVLVDGSPGGGGGMAVPDVVRPAEAATPDTSTAVQRASSSTKRANVTTGSSTRATARKQAPAPRAAATAPQVRQAPRNTTGYANPQPVPETAAPKPKPSTQAPAPSTSSQQQDYSGNYGQDYSGDYGQDYYDWGG